MDRDEERRQKQRKRMYDFIGCAPEEPTGTIARRAREKSDEIEGKHNESLYKILGITLDLRRRCDDPAEWRKVAKDAYWDHRLEKNRPKDNADDVKKSTLVTHFIHAGLNEVRKDRSWKYSRVIHWLYCKGVEPWEVKERIESARGLERLLERATREEPRRSEKDEYNISADETATDVPDEDDECGEDEDSDKSDGDVGAASAAPDRSPRNQTPRWGIDVTQIELDTATNKNTKQKVHIIAVLEECEGKSKWKPWKALKISYL